jgi:hypothetical protein
MTHDQLLKELELLASNSGITVRYEKGEFEGGFCVLRAEGIILVNKKLNTPRKASILAQGLAEIGIDEVYLKPAVREFIEDELARVGQGS